MRRWLVLSTFFMSCGVGWCVARGAKVKTPRGLRNIEDLAVGDEVIVVDPDTLELHVSALTARRSAKRECGRLHFNSGSLTVTSAHPLYDPRARLWAPAGDWLLGVRGEFLGEHGPVRVTRAERFVGVEEVFDLTVAHALHTFVADGVVVHNKTPRREACPVPAEDGRTYSEYDACECGPLAEGTRGNVYCAADAGTPACSCDTHFTSSWVAALGGSEAALRDEGWWNSLERSGPSDVPRVEQWDGGGSPYWPYPVLPGSPNVLRLAETGDGSAGVLTRAHPAPTWRLRTSLWFFKDGALPRALSTGDAGFVMLGVDEQRVWFSLPDQSTWAAPVRSRVWLQLNWDLEILDGGAYVVTPSVAEYERVEAGLGDFRAVDTGESLEDFYADGGTFSFGDAGAPRELVLGHRSAKDGGTGVLRVTGVTLSAW